VVCKDLGETLQLRIRKFWYPQFLKSAISADQLKWHFASIFYGS
jgi:hypothetical protein